MRPRSTTAVAAAFATALVALAATAGARAANMAAFAGTWVIRSSTVAPWKEPTNPLGTKEEGGLVGRTVVFGTKAVTGPSPIGCAKPVYKVATGGPDMIFEGQLAEPRAWQNNADAASLAAKLGFGDPAHIATLDAGCTELQFHQMKPGVLAFGLNNRVYVMTRK
jgi:hypothetical protein